MIKDTYHKMMPWRESMFTHFSFFNITNTFCILKEVVDIYNTTRDRQKIDFT